MTESTESAPSPSGGSGGKIKAFIRKNKTLSIVAGVVGGYFALKELSKGNGGGTADPEYNGEEYPEGVAAAAIGGPQNSTEVSHEAIDEEIADVRQEIADEEREREASEERIEQENENKGEGGGPGETDPGGGATETPAAPSDPGGGGIAIHGKNFAGATSQRIAGSGQSGNKKYVEYVITFPGRQEHWRYFTASGNWQKVNDSSDGPGANKPPTSQKPDPPKQAAPVTKPNKPGNPNKPVTVVSPAAPVAPATNSAEKAKARAEVNRLQGEINGLQGHIGQLTDAIQSHPNAKQRGQWENERNADRNNIEGKRNEVTWWNARA